MDRTNSMGLWTYANNFYLAARVLVDSDNVHTRIPAYYLISHSIELALKAFLRGTGVSLEDLKSSRKFGHNLEKCLAKALKNGLHTYCKVSKNENQAISMINEYYMDKQLNYIKSGYKEFPPVSILTSFTESLLQNIHQHCFDNRNLHASVPE